MRWCLAAWLVSALCKLVCSHIFCSRSFASSEIWIGSCILNNEGMAFLLSLHEIESAVGGLMWSSFSKCLLQIKLCFVALHSFPPFLTLLTTFSHFSNSSLFFKGNLKIYILLYCKCKLSCYTIISIYTPCMMIFLPIYAHI